MGNYYNVTGYKKTGFNGKNRPMNRNIMATSPFTENYVSVDGLTVNREDLMGLTYIDAHGSVKDIKGEQHNDPGKTKEHGHIYMNENYYALEEIDYVRITRTGYPGETDFIDIGENFHQPWKINKGNRKYLQVGFYFVIGLTPLAANVTRIHLALDAWTTLGGVGEDQEITFLNGFKIRGHVSDEEDAKNFFLTPESIGLTEPLISTKQIQWDLTPNNGLAKTIDIVMSTTDLTQFDIKTKTLDAFTAIPSELMPKGEEEQPKEDECIPKLLLPRIKQVQSSTRLKFEYPEGKNNELIDNTLGYFDASNPIVKHNMELLHAAGQLNLVGAFRLSLSLFEVSQNKEGRIGVISGKFHKKDLSAIKQTSSYPRKADYLYRSLVLESVTTGDLQTEAIYNLDPSNGWTAIAFSVPTQDGCSFSRIKGLKYNENLFAKLIKGIGWKQIGVSLDGPMGGLWANSNAYLNAININTAKLENEYKNKAYEAEKAIDLANFNTIRELDKASQSIPDIFAQRGQSFVDSLELVHPYYDRFKKREDLYSQPSGFLGNFVSKGHAEDLIKFIGKDHAFTDSQKLANEVLKNKVTENNLSYNNAVIKAPTNYFTPHTGLGTFLDGQMIAYVIKETDNDNRRLKDYFKRFGYSGLYKKLSENVIDVRKKVNYCEATTVHIDHPTYPFRVCEMAAEVLMNGCFFWKKRPGVYDFDDN